VKLNQVIAVEKSIKARVYSLLTEQNKVAQKPALYSGLSRQYQSVEEGGEVLPPEKSKVHTLANTQITDTLSAISQLLKITAQKDWTNSKAVGDIQVNATTLMTGVPITYLLFLEKQLTDIRTFISNIPVLDENESWSFDAASGLYKTGVISTHRTRKVQRPIVLYPATTEHPAQTQIITEDIIAGHWQAVKMSGALPLPLKQGYLTRIDNLIQAVKMAREQANMVDVVGTPDVAKALFGYILNDTPITTVTGETTE
jgi:hypothetical protein